MNNHNEERSGRHLVVFKDLKSTIEKNLPQDKRFTIVYRLKFEEQFFINFLIMMRAIEFLPSGFLEF